MDLDAFAAAHRDQWDRLDRLVSSRRLTGAQADELVMLYRMCARHLSQVRSAAPDPQLVAELSVRVTAARERLAGTREVTLSTARSFVLQAVPAALYRVRWWTLGVTVAEVALVLVVGVWTLRSPEAMSLLGTPSQRHAYAHEAFEAYYTAYAPVEFAAQVWTSNARLAAVCVAGGVTGVLPALVLWVNAVALGQAGAVMADHGLLGQFLALVLPHGLLELTCVLTAGGAGLRLFWTLLVPGRRSRANALAVEGRVLVTAAVGLTMALVVAGLIEAFVTPAPIPWVLKIAVGLGAVALLWVYTVVLGRRAVKADITGDLGPQEAGYSAPEAG
ncbi:stage II sporulation protein M [Actinomyces lilanjuaniae]|uniref:Stage II sporulation protein M n=1 Tax=Actinomyces lilanjuaniae TaxID=2321394 RepID=A0ABM6Z4U5_9ACTO|nr:stage II sporulation protein M [Actinomyces lilanjuaniae]AYD90235.1 stage II sporulation protein M [Actinomyces lilanjuaniae]